MDSKFDWIAVSLTSSGSGKPFGAEDRIGARVTVGVRMEDTVREIEVPVLIEGGAQLTISEARNAALREALAMLRMVVGALEDQSYEQLADRQNRQDAEREDEFQASLTSTLLGRPKA